jgi:exoribonuclease R
MKHQSSSNSLDLIAIAEQAMIDAGFAPDVPQSVSQEVRLIESSTQSNPPLTEARDLRALPWSSIDNGESRDLDQVEYAEVLPGGDVRLRVGIADVDALVHMRSAIDAHAAENGTSVYTGIRTFPMLPEKLSTDMTSLVGGADRPSIVIEMVLASDGTVKTSDVYRARIHNYAKLAYDEVGAWLDQKGETPAAVRSGCSTTLPGVWASCENNTARLSWRQFRRPRF